MLKDSEDIHMRGFYSLSTAVEKKAWGTLQRKSCQKFYDQKLIEASACASLYTINLEKTNPRKVTGKWILKNLFINFTMTWFKGLSFCQEIRLIQ